MVKIRKMLVFFIVLLLVGTNKVHAATFEGHHLATGIDVAYWEQQAQLTHSFHQNRNVEAILNHLRLLEYAGMPATDPELQQAATYRITVHLADGNVHIYHLHADRYLSRDFRPWVKVESPQSFRVLLQSLPEEL